MDLICKLTDNDIGEKFFELKNPELRVSSRGIVVREDGKIAIINKIKKNEYKLPGGGMENNETPEDAFKREVLEETGCVIEIVKNIGITEEYKYQTNFMQVSNVFVGKVVSETNQFNFTKKEKDEGARLLWMTPQNALELIRNSYNKLIKSEYESVYMTKFIVLRDSRILECYINNK